LHFARRQKERKETADAAITATIIRKRFFFYILIPLS
jgi:hypothetical protein